MAKLVQNVGSFKAERAWGAMELVEIGDVSVKLHWTDKSYKWHDNDGPEAFVVLSGEVDMHYMVDGIEQVVTLGETDIFIADIGDRHVARPRGEARILVVERIGSE
jgi:mannose-6-phosphate isomerase-like protein (cupin superfamily)